MACQKQILMNVVKTRICSEWLQKNFLTEACSTDLNEISHLDEAFFFTFSHKIHRRIVYPSLTKAPQWVTA